MHIIYQLKRDGIHSLVQISQVIMFLILQNTAIIAEIQRLKQSRLNRELRLFPTSLLVGIFGFQEREYLEAAEETDMPSIR